MPHEDYCARHLFPDDKEEGVISNKVLCWCRLSYAHCHRSFFNPFIINLYNCFMKYIG
uniref:Uncharacterized protein n=1 Tax=Arundo donax TaxID=35708 RepID=A0A0A9HD23_ARUDO